MNKLVGYSKGQATAIMGIVLGAVLLFIGLFMVSIVNEVTPESTLKDYGYTTVTNSSSSGYINTSHNGTHSLTIGTIVSISGETPEKTLTIKAENTDSTDRDFDVYVNGVNVSRVTAKNLTNTTTTISNINWVANAKNNITYIATVNVGEDLRVLQATAKYPSSKVDSDWGSINTTLISTMGTIFSVLGLVLIVIALAIAIGALKGTMVGGGKPVA